jgi:hypothetical protein
MNSTADALRETAAAYRERAARALSDKERDILLAVALDCELRANELDPAREPKMTGPI